MKKIEDISQLDILLFLPQRPPFVLVDRIVDFNYDTTATTTSLKLKADTTFVQNNQFQPAGIVENIAQTCAARIGFYDWLFDRPVRIGMIGEVKNMRISTLPVVGDELITTIVARSEVGGITLATAVVKDQLSNLIAQCEIKIAI